MERFLSVQFRIPGIGPVGFPPRQGFSFFCKSGRACFRREKDLAGKQTMVRKTC